MVINKETKLFYLIISLFGIMMFVSIALYNNYDENQYELIEHTSQIKGVVLKFKTSHGSTFVELKNKRKIWIPQSVNYEYDPSGFCGNISKGDSLFKSSNSDTLYLVKKEKKFMFRINEALNTPVEQDIYFE